MTWRYEVRNAEQGMSGSRRIARERSESAYSLETDGEGKTEEVRIGDKEQ